jgi:hypothetical protein
MENWHRIESCSRHTSIPKRWEQVVATSENSCIQTPIGEIKYCLQRVNDKYLMDVVEEDEEFSAHNLGFIKHCQIYPNVITLITLYDESGQQIDLTVPH